MTLIEPHPDAPEGSVRNLSPYSPADFPSTSAILCRCTAPLIQFAFDLLGRGVACTVRGRDIATGLVQMVEKLGKPTVGETLTALRASANERADKLIRKGRSEEAESLWDKVNAIEVFGNRFASFTETFALTTSITDLFSAGPGITLSTIHRAKGLEWETVFILDFHLLPSKWARTEAELQQEHNLIYVAQTRAILNLIYINSNNWSI